MKLEVSFAEVLCLLNFKENLFIIYTFVSVKKLAKSLLFHIISVPSETKYCEMNYNGLTLFRAYFLVVIKRYVIHLLMSFSF